MFFFFLLAWNIFAIVNLWIFFPESIGSYSTAPAFSEVESYISILVRVVCIHNCLQCIQYRNGFFNFALQKFKTAVDSIVDLCPTLKLKI
jgi:hypothetical protein